MAAAALSLVGSPQVVHFLSTPPQPSPPEILPLDPGCDAFEDEVAEETLSDEDLRRLIAELCPDVEGLPPDVVADVEAPVASPADASDVIPAILLLPPVFFRISTPTPFWAVPEEEVSDVPAIPTQSIPLFLPVVEEEVVSSTEETDVERRAHMKVERYPEEGSEIVIISTPEQDTRRIANSDKTVSQRQLSELRRQQRSDLRHLIFWAEKVAKFGEEVT